MANIVFGSGITIGSGISFQYPPPPPPYFIAQGPTSGTSVGRAISIDSSGNMYEVGVVNSSAEINLSKYSVSTGLVIWQYKIDSAYNDNAYSIYIDSSDNIFVAGIAGGDLYPSNPNGQSWIGKFNTSGAIQWQTTIAAEAYGSVINQLVTDSSGNIIVAGYTPNVYGKGWVAKLNSSGTVQWFKTTATESGLTGVATDSSNNIYLVGSGAARGNPGVAMKLDTNGNQQWAKTWAGSAYADGAGGVAVSSSGYVYISFSANNSDAYLAKLSTTDGSQVWQRKLNSGTNDYGNSLSIDSSDNIYWVVNVLYNYSGQVGYQNEKAIMAKYNSSGTIQWQRQMYVSGTSYPNAFDLLNNIKVDNSSNFYVAGQMSAKNILAKLPTDGTLTTATYYTVNGTPIIYNASTLTDSAGSLNLGTGGTYTDTGSYTQSTPTYAVTATSYTTATVVIG